VGKINWDSKEKRSKYNREYRQTHRDKIRRQQREYRQTHKEKLREWRKLHKEQLTEANRKYRESHKEVIKIHHRKYYESHKDEISRKHKEWRKRRYIPKRIYHQVCPRCGHEFNSKYEEFGVCSKCHFSVPKYRVKRNPYPIKCPVVDAFEMSKPLTIEELVERTGARKGYIEKQLKNLMQSNLILQDAEGKYFINPNNPYRYALDGYFHKKEARGMFKE